MHLLLTVKCQKGIINSAGLRSARAPDNHMTAQKSISENIATFRTMDTLCSATSSLKELEHILDSNRMELKEVDEVWPNLYLGNM